MTLEQFIIKATAVATEALKNGDRYAYRKCMELIADTIYETLETQYEIAEPQNEITEA